MKKQPKKVWIATKCYQHKNFQNFQTSRWFNHSRWTTESRKTIWKKGRLDAHIHQESFFMKHQGYRLSLRRFQKQCYFLNWTKHCWRLRKLTQPKWKSKLLANWTEYGAPVPKPSQNVRGFKVRQKHFLENVPLKPEWFPVLKFPYSKNS